MIDALYDAAAPALRGWLDENRARVVAVSQRVAYARGGGSTTMPALDAAHTALLAAFRLFPRHPYGGSGVDFGARTLNALMSRWDFPDDVRRAIVWVPGSGTSASAQLISPTQVKAVRDTLVEEGTLAVKTRNRAGTPTGWAFTEPPTRFSTHDAYAAAMRALFDAPPPTPPVEASTPAFRSITQGEIERLPVGTRLETETGLTHVKLTGDWFLLFAHAGAPRQTRSLIGKVRVTPPDARALWALIMDHAYAQITLAGGVEVTVDVPAEIRALLDAEIRAQDPEAFARRMLATARSRALPGARFPAVREEGAEISEGPGFIRVTFAPLTPSVPLRHLSAPTKDTPLSIEEQRRLARANSIALDIVDDGGKLPADVERLLNLTGRKLTPAEGRRMIAWLDTVE